MNRYLKTNAILALLVAFSLALSLIPCHRESVAAEANQDFSKTSLDEVMVEAEEDQAELNTADEQKAEEMAGQNSTVTAKPVEASDAEGTLTVESAEASDPEEEASPAESTKKPAEISEAAGEGGTEASDPEEEASPAESTKKPAEISEAAGEGGIDVSDPLEEGATETSDPVDETSAEESTETRVSLEEVPPVTETSASPDTANAREDSLVSLNQSINVLASQTLTSPSSVLKTSYKIDLSYQDDGQTKERTPQEMFEELQRIIELIKQGDKASQDQGSSQAVTGDPNSPAPVGPTYTVDLNGGSYAFSHTLDFARQSAHGGSLAAPLTFQIINSSDRAATLTRAKDFSGTMIHVDETAKLILGKEVKPHAFASQEKTVGSVTYTETVQTQKGEFTDNAMIFDGEERNDQVSGRPLVMDIQGETVLNGVEIKNFVNVNKSGSADSSPIRVEGKAGTPARLTINDMDLHDNSFYSPARTASGDWVGSVSGFSAIEAPSHAQIVMNGGKIHNNKASKTTIMLGRFDATTSDDATPSTHFTLNAGEISQNEVEFNGWQFGGGVTVFPDGEFTMNGGKISSNKAYNGGGVFVSSQFINTYVDSPRNFYVKTAKQEKDSKAIFTMNGGEISGNHAQRKELSRDRGAIHGAGGGIYVDSSFATINAGKILNNLADEMGGGIYVSFYPIRFQLKNALITENEAFNESFAMGYDAGNGGGSWNCPTSSFRFDAKDGNLVWKNIASGKGSDIFTTGRPDHFYENDQDVTDKLITILSQYDRYGRPIHYQSQNGSNALITSKEAAFQLYFDPTSLKQALAELPVLIKGNRARKGGGIGSNACVSFGEPGEVPPPPTEPEPTKPTEPEPSKPTEPEPSEPRPTEPRSTQPTPTRPVPPPIISKAYIEKLPKTAAVDQLNQETQQDRLMGYWAVGLMFLSAGIFLILQQASRKTSYHN